jgi:hypothetical protein
MSPPAISILGFGIYLATGGLLLLFVPEWACSLLHLRPPGDTIWARLTGMFFLDVAYYCIQAAVHEERSFIRWSIRTRPLTIVFLLVFVVVGQENPSILIFGVIDLLATLWTALTLLEERPEVGEKIRRSYLLEK